MALGKGLSLEQVAQNFDAVLLAVGEISKPEGEAAGLEMVPGGIKVNAATFQTSRPSVFAAGRAIKPVNQLVKAMAEGQAAAECMGQYLRGKPVCRADKPFSSIMGRLTPQELQTFLKSANPAPAVSGCDACAGLTGKEATTEASRCLHCDCRSAGDCALQTYAQLYDADASRFRQQRRGFEQQIQPGGVIFEPGKCILCGICVKLAELAREPLGLAFIGRGFNVRVAAPFGHEIGEGLRLAAAECVEHCPTGALTFPEGVDTTARQDPSEPKPEVDP